MCAVYASLKSKCELVVVKWLAFGDRYVHACPQDVGIWLETDWYRRQAVIKEIKKDSYAFTSTDVHVRY